MKTSSTLLLAVVSIALLTYVFLNLWDKPTVDQARIASENITKFEVHEVQKISIENQSGNFVINRIGDIRWEIEKPIKFGGDHSTISSLLAELKSTKRMDTLSIKKLGSWEDALEKFGLNNPRIKLDIKTKDSNYTYSFGRYTPVQGAVYMLISSPSKREIVIVDKKLEFYANVSLDQLRNRDVFDFSASKVDKILGTQDQLQVEVLKQDGLWKVQKPVVTQADAFDVSQFMGDLLKLRIVDFAPPVEGTSTHYGLDTPTATLEVSEPNQRVILTIGNAVPQASSKVYASLSTHPVVFTLDRSILDIISSMLERIRDKKIVSYRTPAEILSFELTSKKTSLKLERIGQNGLWTIHPINRHANSALIQNFLTQLQETRILKFSQQLPKSNPNRKLEPLFSLLLTIKDFTNDELKQERLDFYPNTTNSRQLLLQSSKRDEIVLIEDNLSALLPTTLLSWHRPSVIDESPLPLEQVTLSTGEWSAQLNKNENGQWQSLDPNQKIDFKTFNLQLEVLQNLQSNTWLDDFPANAFDQPTLKVAIRRGEELKEIEFSSNPQSKNKILGKVKGDSIAFILSNRDYQTLTINPITKP